MVSAGAIKKKGAPEDLSGTCKVHLLAQVAESTRSTVPARKNRSCSLCRDPKKGAYHRSRRRSERKDSGGKERERKIKTNADRGKNVADEIGCIAKGWGLKIRPEEAKVWKIREKRKSGGKKGVEWAKGKKD